MSSVEQELWNIFTFYTLHGNPLDPEHLRVRVAPPRRQSWCLGHLLLLSPTTSAASLCLLEWRCRSCAVHGIVQVVATVSAVHVGSGVAGLLAAAVVVASLLPLYRGGRSRPCGDCVSRGGACLARPLCIDDARAIFVGASGRVDDVGPCHTCRSTSRHPPCLCHVLRRCSTLPRHRHPQCAHALSSLLCVVRGVAVDAVPEAGQGLPDHRHDAGDGGRHVRRVHG